MGVEKEVWNGREMKFNFYFPFLSSHFLNPPQRQPLLPLSLLFFVVDACCLHLPLLLLSPRPPPQIFFSSVFFCRLQLGREYEHRGGTGGAVCPSIPPVRCTQ